MAPLAPSTGVIAIARRPSSDPDALLADARRAPIVLLEGPRDLGNLGACVRVAAAADVAGVLTTGVHDPWDPAALRGSAGLHFALPVAHLAEDALERIAGSARGDRRPLVAVDPDGEPLRPARLPARAILAFGAERQGLSGSCSSAPTRWCACRCARASRASTSPPRWPRCSTAGAWAYRGGLLSWRLPTRLVLHQPQPPTASTGATNIAEVYQW